MASLTVLSDLQIQQLLEDLTPAELDDFRHVLAAALHDYSTNTQESDQYDQPPRVSTSCPSAGTRTLYMPSSGPAGIGLKIITTSSSSPSSTTASSPAPSSSHSLPHSAATSATPAASSSSSFSHGTLVDGRPPSPPARPSPSKQAAAPTGAVALIAPDGQPTGFLHARTFTGFRTALASMCLLAKRERVQTITVFGSGLQAYWHVRLALKLRGHTVRDVHIINRRFSDGARSLLKTFYGIPTATRRAEGWEQARFSLLTPGYNDYGRLLEEQVRGADVVFCCTPSTEELFPARALTSHDARRKGRLIAAVGSYTPQMRELPDGVLRQALKTHRGGRYFHHRYAEEGGVVVVDTLEGTLAEAGEIVQAGLEPHQLVELGELVMLRRLVREGSDDGDGGGGGGGSGGGIYGNGSNPTTISTTPSDPSVSPRFSFDFEPSTNDGGGGGGGGRHDNGFRRSSTGGSKHNGGHARRKSGSSTPTVPMSPLSPTNSGLGSTIKKKLSLPRRKSLGGQGSSHDGHLSPEEQQKRREEATLGRWLRQGNVIYKSVGFGLMDLVVGMQVVRLAEQKGVGSVVQGFNEH